MVFADEICDTHTYILGAGLLTTLRRLRSEVLGPRSLCRFQIVFRCQCLFFTGLVAGISRGLLTHANYLSLD